jgi:hypothetical protein
VLFAAHGFVPATPAPEAAGRIIVTAADVDRLRELWARQWQRPPTAGELRDLIDGHVREEVLYREALAMGLDRDDTIIKRRLAQKLEFLTADLAAAREPTAAELAAFFAANRERYRLPARVSFSQIYFSPDRRGPTAEQDANLVLAGLQAGTAAPATQEQGDRLLLAQPQREQTAQEIEAGFGRGFADAVLRLAPGGWHGPIASGYGWHLVRVDERSEARLPVLAEVEGRVRSDWAYEQGRQANEAVLEHLLARYEVVVDGSRPGGEPAAGKAGGQP